ncbi:MAG: phosphomannomutase/phosphoglucomutase, partial [Sulfurospirillaceae bacterium]|nr:phosphomannomutase/phosphoglucomutase [Sulfurospirillaceae bacterium]
MEHIFREYDIRGIFQKDLNETSVKAIGYKLGSEILKVGKSVAVGEDARTHSPTIANWLMSGLNEAGIKVYYMG